MGGYINVTNKIYFCFLATLSWCWFMYQINAYTEIFFISDLDTLYGTVVAWSSVTQVLHLFSCT